MPTYPVPYDPSSEPNATVAAATVAYQDEALEELLTPIASEATARVEAQESYLTPIVRALVRSAQRQIAAQQQEIDEVTVAAQQQARAATQSQQATLTPLVDAAAKMVGTSSGVAPSSGAGAGGASSTSTGTWIDVPAPDPTGQWEVICPADGGVVTIEQVGRKEGVRVAGPYESYGSAATAMTTIRASYPDTCPPTVILAGGQVVVPLPGGAGTVPAGAEPALPAPTPAPVGALGPAQGQPRPAVVVGPAQGQPAVPVPGMPLPGPIVLPGGQPPVVNIFAPNVLPGPLPGQQPFAPPAVGQPTAIPTTPGGASPTTTPVPAAVPPGASPSTPTAAPTTPVTTTPTSPGSAAGVSSPTPPTVPAGGPAPVTPASPPAPTLPGVPTGPPTGTVPPWYPDPQNLCTTVDQMVQVFSEIGTWVRDQVLYPIEVTAGHLYKLEDLASLPVVGGLFKELKDVGTVAANLLTRTLILFRHPAVLQLSVRAAATTGLWFTRSLIKGLENCYAGWQLGPQVIVTLQLQATQLERIISYLIEYVFPSKVPSTSDVEATYLAGLITEQQAKCLTELNGELWPNRARSIYARRARPTEDMMMKLWLRGMMVDEELRDRLRGMGWIDPNDQAVLREAYNYVPGPADLIRFAVKDVFDPNKPGLAEMKQELKEQLDLLGLLSAQGIKPIVSQHPDGRMIEYDIPLLYWIASYEEISPNQAYEMLHRLRPDRVKRYSFTTREGRTLTPSAFQIEDVRKLLKEKDYNPAYRTELAAISFRPLGRIDVRRIYSTGIWGEPKGTDGFTKDQSGNWQPTGPAERELLDQYQDQGYAREDAAALSLFTVQEHSKGKSAARARQLTTPVCRAFSLGVLSRDDAIKQLTAAGMPAVEAEAKIQSCDLSQKNRTVQEYITSIRRAFLRGVVLDNDVRELLSRVGILPEKVLDYLHLWSVQKSAQSREVRAAEMCGWAGAGLISYEEMRYRLSAVGYSDTDVQRIIRFCQIGHLARSAKDQRAAAAAAERAQQRAQQEIAKLRKSRATEEERRMGRFLALRSEKNLKAWWAAGQLTEGEIRETFRLKGVSTADVDKWLVVNRPEGAGGEEA